MLDATPHQGSSSCFVESRSGEDKLLYSAGLLAWEQGRSKCGLGRGQDSPLLDLSRQRHEWQHHHSFDPPPPKPIIRSGITGTVEKPHQAMDAACTTTPGWAHNTKADAARPSSPCRLTAPAMSPTLSLLSFRSPHFLFPFLHLHMHSRHSSRTIETRLHKTSLPPTRSMHSTRALPMCVTLPSSRYPWHVLLSESSNPASLRNYQQQQGGLPKTRDVRVHVAVSFRESKRVSRAEQTSNVTWHVAAASLPSRHAERKHHD